MHHSLLSYIDNPAHQNTSTVKLSTLHLSKSTWRQLVLHVPPDSLPYIALYLHDVTLRLFEGIA